MGLTQVKDTKDHNIHQIELHLNFLDTQANGKIGILEAEFFCRTCDFQYFINSDEIQIEYDKNGNFKRTSCFRYAISKMKRYAKREHNKQ